MPSRAKRPCAKPGCKQLGAGRYCEAHLDEPKLQQQIFDKQRSADPVRKLYGTLHWQELRKEVLIRDMLCQECKQSFACDCDHRIPAHEYIRMHGNDPHYFFDIGNLQGLCRECHSRKTAKETNFGRPRDGGGKT